MWKKIGMVAIVIVVTGGILGAVIHLGSEEIQSNIEFASVYTGSFTYTYKTTAQVCGNEHTIYFNGSISNSYKTNGQSVSSGEKILDYLDVYGKKVVLNSDTTGFIKEIGSGYVIIISNDFYLRSYVTLDKFNQLELSSKHLFSFNGKTIEVSVRDKKSYGLLINNNTYYEVDFSYENENLLVNQQGNLILYLQQEEDGLIVDKNALFHDDSGYYLLDYTWAEVLKDEESYRLDVQVLAIGEQEALIEGKMLNDRQVCIVYGQLRSLLDDYAE